MRISAQCQCKHNFLSFFLLQKRSWMDFILISRFGRKKCATWEIYDFKFLCDEKWLFSNFLDTLRCKWFIALIKEARFVNFENLKLYFYVIKEKY